jgi:E3 ubiquitin-protein ligase UBR4
MSDVIAALKMTADHDAPTSRFRPSSPTANEPGDSHGDNDADWIDEVNDDDDSAGEDSDDDSLNNRLCTFTQTQKEFMNQHWYHCHTCKMVDGVGVCSVCAKVCHANHDVTYSKHGSFFCDCGAKEDGSCTALVKRTSSATMVSERSSNIPISAAAAPTFGYEPMLTSSLRRRPSSPAGLNHGLNMSEMQTNDKDNSRQKLAKKLNGWKEVLFDEVSHRGVASNLLDMLKAMVPVAKTNGEKHSTSGRSANLKTALASLHSR